MDARDENEVNEKSTEENLLVEDSQENSSVFLCFHDGLLCGNDGDSHNPCTQFFDTIFLQKKSSGTHPNIVPQRRGRFLVWPAVISVESHGPSTCTSEHVIVG